MWQERKLTSQFSWAWFCEPNQWGRSSSTISGACAFVMWSSESSWLRGSPPLGTKPGSCFLPSLLTTVPGRSGTRIQEQLGRGRTGWRFGHVVIWLWARSWVHVTWLDRATFWHQDWVGWLHQSLLTPCFLPSGNWSTDRKGVCGTDTKGTVCSFIHSLYHSICPC